jgi:DNA-binding NtrC family response regulator
VGKRILVIEDDSDSAEMIKSVISGKPFELFLVNDRDAALNDMLRHSPDVILLDLGTEGIPIQSLIDAMNEHCPHARMILVSTAAGVATIAQALGIRFFLQRPFDPQRLLALIDDALKSGEHAAVVAE